MEGAWVPELSGGEESPINQDHCFRLLSGQSGEYTSIVLSH